MKQDLTKARSLSSDLHRDIQSNMKLDSMKDNPKILGPVAAASELVDGAVTSDFRSAIMVAQSQQAIMKMLQKDPDPAQSSLTAFMDELEPLVQSYVKNCKNCTRSAS